MRRGLPPAGSASRSPWRRSGCSRRASRRRRRSTAPSSSATGTRWGRSSSPTRWVWTCGSRSPSTSRPSWESASDRLSCCAGWCARGNSARRPGKGSTSTRGVSARALGCYQFLHAASCHRGPLRRCPCPGCREARRYGLCVRPPPVRGDLLRPRAALLHLWQDHSLDRALPYAREVLMTCRLGPSATLREVEEAARRIRESTEARLVLAGPEVSRDDGPRAIAAVFL